MTGTAKTQVTFPKPVSVLLRSAEDLNPDSDVNRSSWDYSKRQEMVEELRQAGVDERAIVVRSGKHEYYASSPHNWGIVTNVTASAAVGKAWKPICVRWLNNETTYHFLEDLIVLQIAMTHYEIQQAIRIHEKGIL